MSRQYTLHRPARSTSIHIDYAAELNEQQFAAVTAQPGPQLIIAGAGSGKTRTLTYRVAHLLENAAQYSPDDAPIDLSASVGGEGLRVAVRCMTEEPRDFHLDDGSVARCWLLEDVVTRS